MLYVLWAVMLYRTDAYPEESILFALVYLAIFVGAFALGYVTNVGTLVARRIPRVGEDYAFGRWRLVAVTLVSLPLGLALFSYIALRVGMTSPLDILTNVLLFRGGAGAGGLEYLLFTAFFMIEAPFWAWIIRGNTSVLGRSVLAVYWLVILTVSTLSGARVRVYSAIMGLVFVYHCTKKRISARKALIGAAAAVLPFAAFYQAQGLARAEATTTDTMIEAVASVQPWDAAVGLTGRFADAFEGFIKIIDRSDHLEFLWGRSLIDALFLPIPRAWIPDKPSSFNYQALEQLHPERVGQFYGEEYGVLGELFMNWHLAGVLLGGIVFGMIIKMLTRYYMANRDNAGFVFLYRPLFLALPMAWMTSGLINSEAHSILLMNLAAGLLFLRMARSTAHKTDLGTRRPGDAQTRWAPELVVRGAGPVS